MLGWPVGKDRVERIWRRDGLKVPQIHQSCEVLNLSIFHNKPIVIDAADTPKSRQRLRG